MKKNKNALAIAALVIALLLSVLLLPVLTGLTIRRQLNLQPMVTASPPPGPDAYGDSGL